MNRTSRNLKPPIIEMVVCAQFAQLTKLTMAHYGLFWKELGDDWIESRDGTLIEDRFELFDHNPQFPSFEESIRIAPLTFPGRAMFIHKNGDLLLQIQGTRLLLNWRKAECEYPRYEKLITVFEQLHSHFVSFCERHGIHTPQFNQWELTYVDSFSKGDYWQTPDDWVNILPGLFAKLFSTEALNLTLDHRAAQWSFEIEPKKGRLHVNAHAARLNDSLHETLLLTMTARGPIRRKEPNSLRIGLDLGHETILKAFERLVNPEVYKQWGIES